MPITPHHNEAGRNDRSRNSVAGRFAPAPILALTTWTLLLPVLGCYSYVPVAGPVTPSTGESAVVLTPAGTVALQQQLGNGVRELNGTIVRVTTDSLEMLVTQTTTLTRERFTQNAMRVAIARPLVQEVQAKTLSRKRTWAMLGGMLLAIIVALSASSIAGASSSGDGTPSPIQP